MLAGHDDMASGSWTEPHDEFEVEQLCYYDLPNNLGWGVLLVGFAA